MIHLSEIWKISFKKIGERTHELSEMFWDKQCIPMSTSCINTYFQRLHNFPSFMFSSILFLNRIVYRHTNLDLWFKTNCVIFIRLEVKWDWNYLAIQLVELVGMPSWAIAHILPQYWYLCLLYYQMEEW